MTPEQLDQLCQAVQAVGLAADVLEQLLGDLATVIRTLRSSGVRLERLADDCLQAARPALALRDLVRDG